MSTTVESRVVEMRFDNQDFEQNASATLEALKNLDKSLNDFSGVDSLGKISDAASKADLSVLERGVESVKEKFSALEIIAVGALMNIGSKAADAGVKLLQSVTTDQIIAGWDKYATKTEAVQTIMAATGKSMGEVTESLEKLNWFTDETSYNLIDMTTNIGKFTSNGVELDTAVTSMMGIANAAALSGSGIQSASHAMEGFSKAIAQGEMTRINWNWIKTARMDTKQFKETLIDAGLATGTLVKGADGITQTLKGTTVTYADFESAMHEGWLNTETLLKGLDQYGKFTDNLYTSLNSLNEVMNEEWTTSELLDALEAYQDGTLDLKAIAEETGVTVGELEGVFNGLADAELELGQRSLRAAQEAKTFGEAIGSVQDAVSTGWMQTFELIFGNYEEAKKIWTDLANELYDVFAESGNARNEMLAEWKELGGRDDLFRGIAAAWESIKSIMEAVKSAFREVFPPMTAETLAKITKAFADLMEKLTPSETTLDNISRTFKGLFSVLKIGTTVIKAIAFAFKPLVEAIGRLIISTGRGTASVTAFFGDGLVKAEEVIRRVVFALAKLINLFLTFATNIPIAQIAVKGLATAFELLMRGIDIVKTKFSELANSNQFIGGLVSAAKDIANVFTNILPSAFASGGFKGLFSTLLQSFNNFIEKIRSIKIIDDIFSGIETGVKTSLGVLKNFGLLVVGVFSTIVKKIKTTSLKDIFDDLLEKVKGIGKAIIEFFQNLDLKSVIGKIREHILGAGEGFQSFIEKVKAFAAGITPAKIAALAFSIAILALANSFAKASEAFASIGGLAAELKKRIVAPFQSLIPKISPLLQFSIAVIAVSKSLKMLSDVPAEKLKAVVASISTLTVVLGGMIGILSVVTNKIGGGSEGLESLSKMLLSFGVGIGAMAAGLAILNASGDFTDALPKIAAMMAIIVAFGTMATLMSKIGGGKAINSIMLISFASSLVLVMKSFSAIASLPTDGLKEKIMAMTVIMAAMGVLAAGLGNIRIGSVVGVLLLKDFLVSLLPEIVNAISGLKLDPNLMATLKEYETLVIGLTAVTGAVATGLVFALSSLAKSMSKLTAGLIGLGICIMLMGQTAKSIKEAKFSDADLFKAGAFISALLVFIGMVVKAGSGQDAGKYAIRLSVMIISVTAMVALLSLLAAAIGDVDVATLLKGGVTIGALLLLFSVLIQASSKSAEAKMGVILGAVVGVVALCAELIVLTFIPWEDIQPALKAIVAVMLGLYLLMDVMSDIKFNPATATGLLAMVGVISAIGASLYILKDTPWDQLAAGALSLGGVLVVLGFAMKLMSKLTIDLKSGILLGVLVLELSAALRIIGEMPVEQAITAAVALSGVLVVLGIVAQGLSEVKVSLETFLGIAAAVGGVVATVLIFQMLTPVLQEFATIDWDTLGKAGATLAGMVGGIYLLSKAGVEGALGAIGLIAIAAAMHVLIPALNDFLSVEWESLGKAGLVLLGLTGAVAALGALKEFSLMGAAALAIVSVSIIGISFALKMLGPALEQIEPNLGVLPKLAGGLALIAFAGGVALLGAPGMIATGLALKALAGPLDKLSSMKLSNLGGDFGKMAAGLVAFGVAGAGLGMVSPLLLLAAAGILALGKAIEATHSAFSTVIPAMVSAFKSGAQTLASLASGLAQAFLAPLKALIAPVVAIAKLIGKGLELGFRDGAQYHSPPAWIVGFANDLSSFLTGFFNSGEVTESASGFGRGIAEAITGGMSEGQSVVDNLAQSMTGISGLSDQLVSQFGGLSLAGTDLTSSLQMVGSQFDYNSFGAELFNGQLTMLNTSLGQTHIAGSETAQSIDALFGYEAQGLTVTGELATKNDELSNSLINLHGHIDQSSQGYANLREAIGGSMNILEEFKGSVDISGQEMLENMQNHLNALSTWADNVALLGTRGIDEGLLQKLVDMGPEGAAQVNAFAGMTAEELARANELWAASLKLPEEATRVVAEGMKAAAEGAKQGWTETNAANAGEYVDSINAPMEDAVEQVNRTWQTNSPSLVMKQLGENVMQGFKIGISGPARSQVMTAITQFGNEAVRKFTTIAKEMTTKFSTTFRSNVSAITNAINNGFNQAKNTATTSMQQLVTAVKNTANSAISSANFNNNGKTIVENIAEAVKQYTSTLTNAMESAITSTKSAAEGAVSSADFASVGQAISEGIAKGIESYVGAIAEAAKAAVAAAKAAAQKEAAIESPSKVFMKEVGQPISAGIAKGISNNTFMAENASRSLIETILDSMMFIDEYLSGNVDLNPVITPTIDLSYVNSGVDAINRAFESKRLLAVEGENDSMARDGSKGSSIVFNQYNTSPKALSRLDIYRDTKNLLSAVKVASRG